MKTNAVQKKNRGRGRKSVKRVNREGEKERENQCS